MPTRIPSSIQQSIKKYPPFYQKVWKECARIPSGETRSYGWIARAIGHPKAARAVGRALAANPFAPTIPCHRVIGADGRLTGYSATGGLVKKAQLLAQERRGFRALTTKTHSVSVGRAAKPTPHDD